MNGLYGMVGIGVQELLLLGCVCLFWVIVVAVVIVVVLRYSRKKNRDSGGSSPINDSRNSDSASP